MSGDLAALQRRIGHAFRDPELLRRALTHASWVQDNPGAPGNNQRLEFLGDSVLQLVLTEALYALFPEDREGELTKRRAVLGKGEFLSSLAREIGLDACLLLGANEEASGGRSRDAALEDAFEALIGAVYLDAGPRERPPGRPAGLRGSGRAPGDPGGPTPTRRAASRRSSSRSTATRRCATR